MLTKEIVIVGGGPIGLAHAWGMKKLNPDLRVLVFEKYPEYQRSHTLIMEPEQLNSLMKATNTTREPALVQLLSQLRKDRHIRTNSLEAVFKELASANGVEIIHEEIKKDNLVEQISKHCKTMPEMIIGADGTHSVVSDTLFPEGNQVKHEFDYVLQLRYEIKGEDKSKPIDQIAFYQSMARRGLIANEYVGHFADGKTPVTMQMMISKEAFLKLKKATSKNPIKPFEEKKSVETVATDIEVLDQKEDQANSEPGLTFDEIPDEKVKRFILDYLDEKIAKCHKQREIIDHDSIRISVNEAPATHAKKVTDFTYDIPKLLAGDAALGLSYFKGLNAGLQSTAKFFTYMKGEIEKGFKNQFKVKEAMQKYEKWFLQDFAPSKINEVARYSTWNIRSFMKLMRGVQFIKMASKMEDEYLPHGAFKDYFKLFANHPLRDLKNKTWQLFPHRNYDLVKLGQFAHIPVRHHLVKIGKLFADYVKPYKSSRQAIEDFKQPLVGLVNFSTGILKAFVGLFTLDGKRFTDGLFSFTRGIIEIATTPLTWLVKPITRVFATAIHGGRLKIEETAGIQELAELGKQNLQLHKGDDPYTSRESTYALLAICHDLHRKFVKSTHRGQPSAITELAELTEYNRITSDNELNKENLKNYFSLFAKKPSVKQQGVEQEIPVQESRPRAVTL